MWSQESYSLGKIEKKPATEATGTRGEDIERIPKCNRMAKKEDKKVYVFKNNASLGWKCRNCGHISHESIAPKICPVCSHPQAYFERMSENH